MPTKKTLDFLPDLCTPKSILHTLVIVELLAIIIALVGSSHLYDLAVRLAFVSLFVLWTTLISVAFICIMSRLLPHLTTKTSSLTVWLITSLVTLMASIIAEMADSYQHAEAISYWNSLFIFKNIFISSVMTLVFLRYFYIQHQWQLHMQADTSAKYDALSSRMRPHFLFNALNTIAQLIHINQDQAEEAILDLAGMMRTILDKRSRISLQDELDLTIRYLNMEGLRLGKRRLTIVWDMDKNTLPFDMEIPPLILQPLVENAIYHGIQPRQDGGTLGISLYDQGDSLQISVTNPIPPEGAHGHKAGNHIAQENMKKRLKLAYGDRANLKIAKTEHQYRVSFSIPKE
ncbi:MAG TPA: histidine kinase [Thiothrix sp.]|nr:histidine kinase [Thiothrix sp.]